MSEKIDRALLRATTTAAASTWASFESKAGPLEDLKEVIDQFKKDYPDIGKDVPEFLANQDTIRRMQEKWHEKYPGCPMDFFLKLKPYSYLPSALLLAVNDVAKEIAKKMKSSIAES